MSDMVLPPVLHDRVNELRNSKNSRIYRDNIYNNLIDVSRALMKACEEFEKETKFRKR